MKLYEVHYETPWGVAACVVDAAHAMQAMTIVARREQNDGPMTAQQVPSC